VDEIRHLSLTNNTVTFHTATFRLHLRRLNKRQTAKKLHLFNVQTTQFTICNFVVIDLNRLLASVIFCIPVPLELAMWHMYVPYCDSSTFKNMSSYVTCPKAPCKNFSIYLQTQLRITQNCINQQDQFLN